MTHLSFYRRRPSPNAPGRPPPPINRHKPPSIGGTLKIAIVEAPRPAARARAGVGPTTRDARARVRAALDERAKLGFLSASRHCDTTADKLRPSDEVEGLRFQVTWTPERNALNVPLADADLVLPQEALVVVRVAFFCEISFSIILTSCSPQNAADLDFDRILRTTIDAHARAIVRAFATQLIRMPVFRSHGDIDVLENGMHSHLGLCFGTYN
jgi:mediator of RNA polymerase II transcription subunit 14